jgi:integrase
VPTSHLYSAAEIHACLSALKGRSATAWALLFYAGLRLHELAALRWDDIDPDGGTLAVCRRTPNGPARPGGAQALPFLPELAEHLRGGSAGSGHVFDRDGMPASSRVLRQLFRRGAARSGLEPLCLHDAR